jgi:hypothetical protein
MGNVTLMEKVTLNNKEQKRLLVVGGGWQVASWPLSTIWLMIQRGVLA